MNGINLGIVVATYPKGNSIDVVLISDGSRLSNVQVASMSASSNTGLADLPDIGAPNGNSQWDLTQPVTRLVQALIMFISGIPVCTGFLFPQEGQMNFDRKNFKVDRHPSDVYSTINASGDLETYHPSGTYFRIGSSPAHEDLTAQDYDKQWAINNNTGSAVHAHLVVANAGTVVATIDIDPSGNVSLTHNGNLTTQTNGALSATVNGNTTITAKANLQATVSGTTSVNSSGNLSFTAPQITLNGTTIINGATQINNTLTTSGLATLGGLAVT